MFCNSASGNAAIRRIPKRENTIHQQKARSLAEDFHRFIGQPTWLTWPPDAAKSGTTWFELLARFDTRGHRSVTSTQSKDDDAQHRFMLRSSRAKRSRDPAALAFLARAACSRPSLALKMRTFKATFKRVIRHYLLEKAHALFQAPASQADKRLRNLGINTHMASVSGVIDTSEDLLRNQPIEQAILRQRTATSAKKLKAMPETNARNNVPK